MPQSKQTIHTAVVFSEKLAARSGGDRYKGILNDQPWQIYLPQAITRRKGAPHKTFKITIEEVNEDMVR